MMVNSKIIVLLVAASLLVTFTVGVALAQYATAQTNSTNANQNFQGSDGVNCPYPQQGCYAYGYAQNGYCYGNGNGRCSGGCFW